MAPACCGWSSATSSATRGSLLPYGKKNHLFRFGGNRGAKVPAIIGILSDITERKQTEEALRETEAKYRSLFVNAVDGIYRTTRTGQFIDANPALARMLGYPSPEELMAGINSFPQQLYVEPGQRSELTSCLKPMMSWRDSRLDCTGKMAAQSGFH